MITNRKSHTPFYIKWKSSNLNDLKGHWQPVRSADLATAKVLVFIIKKLVFSNQSFIADSIQCNAHGESKTVGYVTCGRNARKVRNRSYSKTAKLQTLKVARGRPQGQSKFLNIFWEWDVVIVMWPLNFKALMPLVPH